MRKPRLHCKSHVLQTHIHWSVVRLEFQTMPVSLQNLHPEPVFWSVVVSIKQEGLTFPWLGKNSRKLTWKVFIEGCVGNHHK